MTKTILPFEMAAAGLLHDIGKVLQPARINLHPEAAKLDRIICPEWKGHYSHRHVLFTAHALIAATSNFGTLDRDRIERIAIHHHRPSSERLDEHLLTKADWLASGHDRESTTEEEERTGLAAIVASLSWPNQEHLAQAVDQFCLPTIQLSFEDVGSLPAKKGDFESYQNSCALLSTLLAEGLKEDFSDPLHCLDGLLGLTQRLLHAIPASRYRGHIPDVSLYDHSRMVAAIAACLAKLPHDGPIETNKLQGRFRFVTLGVGGIQNFIFRSIPQLEPGATDTGLADSKGSAKRLRARSFYLSLFSWLASRRVLQALEMPPTNLVYDAGGHALLLIPDTGETIQETQRVLVEIAREIREGLGGTLRFDFAVSDPLQDFHFHRDHFQEVLRNIESARANSRFRFPDTQLRVENGWTPEGWVAAREPSLPVDRQPFLDNMRELGAALGKARYLAIDCHDHGLWHNEILQFQISLHRSKPTSGRVFALELNETDLTTPLYLSGTHLPKASVEVLNRLPHPDEEDPPQAGDTLTFSDLAQLSTTDDGIEVEHSMLGVFKADVDLLGALMTYGFTGPSENDSRSLEETGNRATLGRLAALSRSLDQFFKGFLTSRLHDEYRHIYTVFLGGDDLFLIGPWYDLVRFSRDLHSWFERFTCKNPNVTFSAGLVFTKPTTPVRRLATLAEDALEQAKTQGRNRIAYGSVVLSWSDFHEALKLHQQLHGCAREAPGHASVNSSLTYRLLQYSKQAIRCGEQASNPQSTLQLPFADMKWRAQMSYDLKRNLPLGNGHKPELDELHHSLLAIHSPEKAKLLYVAASLTLYLLRGAKR